MKVLYTREQIQKRCAELGKEIAAFYAGNDPLTVVTLLNGGMIFSADLVRNIDRPLFLDTFAASSYRKDRSTGELVVRSPAKLPVTGRHVLLTDDILDTGLTMRKTIEFFCRNGALSVRTCVMLDKETRRAPGGLEHADWCGFYVPDLYIVGYGLDSEEHFRNLPDIAVYP